MTTTTGFAVWEIKAFLRRRRWVLAGVFVLVSALVMLVAMKLPSVYEASSLIVVESRDTEQTYPGGLLTPRLEQRLRLAQGLLKSEALVKRALTTVGLVAEGDDPVAVSETLRATRDKLDIRVTGVDMLEIALQGTEPEQISGLVNALVGLFLAENASYSQRVVSGASTLIAEDVKQSDEQLRLYEARIKAFRERYADELPDQLTLHLTALDGLEQRALATTRELRETKDRTDNLERDLAATPKTLPPERLADAARATASPAETLAGRLDTLQAALETARTKYTETHPEVVRLRRAVAEATARLAAEPAALERAPDSATPARPEVPNPAYAALLSSYELGRATVAGLTKERAELAARIADLRARIQRVPRREQELATLTRDYEALKERHRGMTAKLFQADLSRKVASDQRDDVFRVVDRAVPPVVPVRPRRILIALAGLCLAAGTAVAAAWLVDRVVDTTFHSARVVEDALKLPVLAVIPLIATAGRRSRA